MSSYGPDVEDAIASMGRAQPPASLGEVWNANWQGSGLETMFGQYAPRQHASDDLTEAWQRVTGATPEASAQSVGRTLATSDYGERAAVLNSLAAGLPDEQQKALKPYLDVDAGATKYANEIVQRQAGVNERSFGLTAHATAWMADMSRQLVDPMNVAGAALGGPETGGLGVMVAREFAVNAGFGALQHVETSAEMQRLGLPQGSIVGDALSAGLFGTALGLGMRAAGYALRRVVGEPNAPRIEGLIETAPHPESPVMGLDPMDFEAAAQHQERNVAIDALASGLPNARAAVDDAAARIETGEPAAMASRAELGAVGTAHPEAPADAGAVGETAPAEGAPPADDWAKMWTAYQDLKREQGGFTAVPIADLIERSGLSRDAVHALLTDAARTGDASLHHATSVNGVFEPTPENKANWISLPGEDEPFVTAALKNERRAGGEDAFPGDEPSRQASQGNHPDALENPASARIRGGEGNQPAAFVEPTAGKAPKRPETLRAFVKRIGGVKDEHGDLADLRKGYPGLINNKRGQSLDDAREAAAQAGYFGFPIDEKMAGTTPADLVDALRDDRGVYSGHDDGVARDFEAHRQRAAWIEQVQIHARDIDAWSAETGEKLDAEHRWTAAELLADDKLHAKGEMTPDDAVEQAAVMLYNRDAEAAHARGETTYEPGSEGRGGQGAGDAGGGQGRRGEGTGAGAREPVRDAGAPGGEARDGETGQGAGAAADLTEPTLAAQRADVERGLAAAEAAGDDMQFVAADGTPVQARAALSAVDEFKIAAKELGACIVSFGA